MHFRKLTTLAAILVCLAIQGPIFGETQVGNTSYSPSAAVFNGSLWVASTYGSVLQLERLDLFGAVVQTVVVGVADVGPRIEAFNGLLYIFYHDGGSASPAIRYRTMTTGNVVSAETILAAPLTDTSSVGTAVFNNRLYVLSRINGVLGYNYLNTSGVWAGGFAIASSAAHAPDLAVANNTLYAIYGGQSSPNDIYYRTISATDVIGAETTIPGGVYENSGPAGAEFSAKLYVVYRGYSSNRLKFKTMTAAGAWAAEGTIGPGKTAAGPALVVFANKLWIFYKGYTSNNKYFEQVL